MRRLREEAARRRTTMSALVEAGLRHILAAPETVKPSKPLRPLPSWNGGGFLLDITDKEEVDRVLNAEKDERLYGIRREK